MRIGSKAQAWSTDLMLAMVAFGIIAVIFYAVVSTNDANDITTLQDDAEYISTIIKAPGDTMINNIIRNNNIDPERLQGIINEMASNINDFESLDEGEKYYKHLKAKLNIDSDFCIYMEDKNDRLVIHRSTNTIPPKCFGGIGSPEYFVLKSPVREIRCGMPMKNC